MEFENGHPKPACKDKILVMIEFPTLGKLKILQESPLLLGLGSSVTGQPGHQSDKSRETG
jgi:hypothetical protein